MKLEVNIFYLVSKLMRCGTCDILLGELPRMNERREKKEESREKREDRRETREEKRKK